MCLFIEPARSIDTRRRIERATREEGGRKGKKNTKKREIKKVNEGKKKWWRKAGREEKERIKREGEKEREKIETLTNKKENGSGKMFRPYASLLLAISIRHPSGEPGRQLGP